MVSVVSLWLPILVSAIVVFLVSYVVPQVAGVFAGTKQSLPFLTVAMLAISGAVRAWDALEGMGIAGITDVYCPKSVGFGTSVRVQIEKKYAGHARQIAACLWAATPTCLPCAGSITTCT